MTAVNVDNTEPIRRVQAALLPLPEKLKGHETSLVLSDGIISLVVLIAAAALHEERGALVVLAMLLFWAYASGRYRQSYATMPRDEIYATMAFSAPALALALAAGAFLDISLLAMAVAGVLWIAAACACAVRCCRVRRGANPARVGAAGSVDHHGRLRSRSPLRRLPTDVCDVVLAAIAIVVLSPLFAACAIAVALDSGLPVIFSQRRVGEHDREFTMYKFRTMRRGAGANWVTPGDQRVTRIGRFLRRTSLDELPQLVNVLKRDMSLVGPRPEMTQYAEGFAYEFLNYADRHLIRPGITGWAQLNYDRNFSPDDVCKVLPYDLFYVRHRSVYLYCYCLIKTAFEVIFHRAV